MLLVVLRAAKNEEDDAEKHFQTTGGSSCLQNCVEKVYETIRYEIMIISESKLRNLDD